MTTDRHRHPASAVAGLLLLALSLAACSLPGTRDGSASAKVGSPGSGGGLSPAALIKRVALVDADLTSASTVRLIPSGDQVTGQVTLNNCGFTFASEANRVARRQVVVMPALGQPISFSNEVVVYDTAAHAAQAIDELRSSVTNCRTGVYLAPAAAGRPAIRYDISELSSLATLPVKDNAVATVAVSDKGMSGRTYGTTILQRQGTVLDIIYLQSPQPPSTGELEEARSLASITGARLAATEG